MRFSPNWEARPDAINWPMFLDCLSSNVGPLSFAYDLINNIPVDVSEDDRQKRTCDIIHALGGINLPWSLDRVLETMSMWFCSEDQIINEEVIKSLAKFYLISPQKIYEYLARCQCGTDMMRAVERRISSEKVRGEASQPAGGVLYFLYSNPRLSKDWRMFLIEDIGGSNNFDEAVQKAANRIIRVLVEDRA